MSKGYTPADWYWIVNGDTTRAYSSAAGDFVPSGNAAFLAWRADGTEPTRIDSLASLGQVLAEHQLRPTQPQALDAYNDLLATQLTTEARFRILFNHENRLRAIERALSLNGSPANLTPAQAKAAVKALL